ncbi:MAG: hypothetical protein J5879_02565 [Clostridia bacterium]|nr:hypothetical protein [Clostridia bacterium]
MKKNDKLYEAVSNIDDGMIQTAYARQAEKKVRSGIIDAIGIAASIVLVALFGVFLSLFAKKDVNIAGTGETGQDTEAMISGSEIKNDTKESAAELVDISNVREISGNYYWESTAEIDRYSAAVGMKLADLLKIDSISQSMPTLMPENYIILHTGMAGSAGNAEDAYDLTFTFIDNTNKIVKEQRDPDGNVIYNKNAYNSLVIFLYNKSFWNGSRFIYDIACKYQIKGSLSADSVNDKYARSESECSFLIETDKYYIVYEYRGGEGGKRDLNGEILYEIASSVPYIKDNGYTASELTVTEHDAEMVKDEYAELLPDDFGFSITWFDGMCSYDSRTGTLIKDKNASDVSRFTTTYKMESEMLFKIYEKLFDKIIISSYPDEYDPLDAASAEAIEASGVKLETVVISVTADGEEKTVTCKNIQFGGEGGYDERAREFIEAEYAILERIMISPEWQALPEFESL